MSLFPGKPFRLLLISSYFCGQSSYPLAYHIFQQNTQNTRAFFLCKRRIRWDVDVERVFSLAYISSTSYETDVLSTAGCCLADGVIYQFLWPQNYSVLWPSYMTCTSSRKNIAEASRIKEYKPNWPIRDRSILPMNYKLGPAGPKVRFQSIWVIQPPTKAKDSTKWGLPQNRWYTPCPYPTMKLASDGHSTRRMKVVYPLSIFFAFGTYLAFRRYQINIIPPFLLIFRVQIYFVCFWHWRTFDPIE